MTRKDPVTGVEVLTMPEFFERMGEQEGKTGGESFDDFLSEFDRVKAEDDERFRKPENLLIEINRLLTVENEFRELENNYIRETLTKQPYKVGLVGYEYLEVLPLVESLIEVIEAEQNYGPFGGGSKTKIVVRVRRVDGQEGRLSIDNVEIPATSIDPPDGDTNIEWDPTR